MIDMRDVENPGRLMAGEGLARISHAPAAKIPESNFTDTSASLWPELLFHRTRQPTTTTHPRPRTARKATWHHSQTPPDYDILPSMGSAINTATAFLTHCDCTLAASATPSSARPFGLSQTDASFPAVRWLLAGGPP